MATVRQRKGKWQVQIRRCKLTLSRTFLMKTDALRWANQMEVEADRKGTIKDTRALGRTTVAEILTRFRDEVCPRRKGGQAETIVINAFLRQNVANTTLADFTADKLATYRDERLTNVRPATVIREFGLLQSIFETAKKEWNFPLAENPFKAVRKPKADHARQRRLAAGEWEALLEASQKTRNPFLESLVRLAIETGMRRGELLAARWEHLNWQSRTLHIPVTKTDTPRTIPLTSEALRIFRTLAGDTYKKQRIIPITAMAAKLAWKRLTIRAGIDDLHFHDLRHEAVSRFFERGLSVPEVALISGHKDPRMLFRYTHIKAEDVADKLNLR